MGITRKITITLEGGKVLTANIDVDSLAAMVLHANEKTALAALAATAASDKASKVISVEVA